MKSGISNFWKAVWKTMPQKRKNPQPSRVLLLALSLLLSSSLNLSLIAASAGPANLTLDQKLSDIRQLSSLIESSYGPLKFKETQLGIRISDIRDKYLAQAIETQTNAEFYYLVVKMVAEFRDSHFRAWLPGDFIASLPFSTDLVEGKVLIAQIDRSAAPESTFPFVAGDEIVEMDGRPMANVLDELQSYVSAGYDLTARRTAAMHVSWRPSARIPAPAIEQQVILKIRHGASPNIEEVKLNWKTEGTPIDEVVGKNFGKAPWKSHIAAGGNFPAHRFSLISDWAEFENPRLERSFRCSGSTRIAIPSDATILMKEPFVAYYHPTPKGNVGYLRIPNYLPVNPLTGAFEIELRFKQYEWAISIMEANTVGLVIDQDHNCGGSLYMAEDMVGLFMSTPFRPTDFTLLATKGDYVEFKRWLSTMNKNTVEYTNFAKTVEIVQESWKKGEFMTPKLSFRGAVELTPNPIRYTHPVLMLIDELSGSGGDAFPALMQGHGRAKLLGTRTMGAGGHVVELEPLYFSQVDIRMTKSLFYRPDGVPVENNGVVPDYPYTPTRDDYINGYRGYQAFYVDKLLELVQ